MQEAERSLELWEQAYRDAKKAVKKAPNNSSAASSPVQYSLAGTDNVLFDELTVKEYTRLLQKKPINISKQDKAMLQSQRMSKYAGLEESEIPILDIFRIGYDTEINNGIEFYVRNDGLSDFSVVKKTRIAPNKYIAVAEEYQNNGRSDYAGTDKNYAQSGHRSRNSADGGVYTGDERTISTNASSSQTEGKSIEAISSSESATDSRPGVKSSVSGTEDILEKGLRKRLQETVDQYGALPAGETPARDATVPKRTSKTKRVSMTVRTALEAGVTPNMMVPAITKEVLDETFSYERKSNKDLQVNAKAWMEKFQNVDLAVENFTGTVSGQEYIEEGATVKGYYLYNELCRAAQHAKPSSEYVFPSPTGGPISPDSVNNMLKRVLARAGIPKVRFHDLRHTFATIALQNGVDIKTVSSILGHFSDGFTLDTYAHITTAAQKEAAIATGNLLN